MTEHKFTDEEVIKALEHCGSKHTDNYGKYSCLKCPLFTFQQGGCSDTLHDFALDLINRQKAEIAYWMDEAANAKKEAAKEFADRLKKKLIEGGIYPVLVKNSMDKLLKEMTGEKE
jgi:hypothetical protein